MKKILLSILMVFAVALTACSPSSSTAQASTGALSETQLVLGSLKLEDTSYGITVEQANELLPMWQVYDELTNSDTAAQEEIDALVEQIQETMTSEQIQAITDMQLTQQDVFTTMQTTNIASTSQSDSSVTVPSSGGGMPAGGPPDGGGGAPPDMSGGMPSDAGGGDAPNTGAGQSQNAQTGSDQAQMSAPSALVQALIESLEQKIQA
ncbi:MAG: hypothetical protein IPP66_07535 [Anaerolineales bacterium]|nr:hypothetical protein [Anaerolineales bacterium]